MAPSLPGARAVTTCHNRTRLCTVIGVVAVHALRTHLGWGGQSQ
jgi:hypothetical protein